MNEIICPNCKKVFKVDEARLLFKLESSLLFYADAQIQTANSRMLIKTFNFTSSKPI